MCNQEIYYTLKWSVGGYKKQSLEKLCHNLSVCIFERKLPKNIASWVRFCAVSFLSASEQFT